MTSKAKHAAPGVASEKKSPRPRRAVRLSVRFDVFKRDSFTCSYCGRRPPTVVLEVDHIVPVASGGGNEPENLTTACRDCNGGKGAKHLNAEMRPAVAADRAEEIQERALQAKAYAEAIEEQQRAESRMLDSVNRRWAEVFGAETTPTGWKMPEYGPPWPSAATIRNFLTRIPLDEILKAIDITATSRCTTWKADRYFYAVCWRRIRGEDMR
jgi:hypothetical protein